MSRSTIELEILRYHPENVQEPSFQTYEIEYREDWVVLDALNYIKDHVDGTLSYRWSCRMGVCGSCGMMINGQPQLSCAAFLKDYWPDPVRVEPLANFPIERDLVTVMDDFIENLNKVKPWIIREDEQPLSDGEYRQSPAELDRYKQFSMCINCMLCYSACPVVGLEPEFTGPAAIALAQRYNKGQGVEPSDEKATHWFLQSALGCNTSAMKETARRYQQGTGTRRDLEVAAHWHGQLSQLKSPYASRSDRVAAANLRRDLRYQLATGIPATLPAFGEVEKKAATGDAEAQFLLGIHLKEGAVVAKNEDKAMEWITKASDAGNAAAQYFLAVRHDEGSSVSRDDKKAVALYRKAAAQDHAAAANNLAVKLDVGDGVSADADAALALYQQAADLGYASAQYNLAIKLETQDDAKALEWYRKAAGQGHADAQNNLGIRYAKGLGVPADAAKAAQWYRRAAEQGHSAAQANLASLYHEGKGVPRDSARAYKWWGLAAIQGEPQAVSSIRALARNMDGDSLNEARRLIIEFVPYEK